MSDDESDYEYKGEAVVIQPDPDNRTVKMFHRECRPQHGGTYVIVSRDPSVDFDEGGTPTPYVCPECGHEILTTLRAS